jgi:aminoglycoside phosphotransferase (APT) family kinase protein
MSESALAWVAEMLGAHGVRQVRSLTFGIASDVQLLEADGRQLVLRRYLDESIHDDVSAMVSNEATVLRAAGRVLGRLVPQPLAVDPSGDHAGSPAVLMTFLPGAARIHGLDPERLAQPLAALHGSDPPAELPPFRHWIEPTRVAAPSWSKTPEAWMRLAHVLQDPAPESAHVFMHRDYHPGNLLWEGDDLVGIVDWALARCGPPGADIAHTRANLALVDGPEAADTFLDAYGALAPSYEHQLWWDAAELYTWRDDFSGILAFNTFGANLDGDILHERADAYARSLLL